MTKPFRNTHQQLEILHKRGLTIPNYQDARQYLLTNNYYSIINGYSKYFYQTPNKYHQGITFDEISHAYLFDREIKYTLLKAIFDAENHLSSIFAYTFAEKYPDIPEFYLDASSYKPPKCHQHQLNYSIKQIEKLLNKHKKRKPALPSITINEHTGMSLFG